MSDIAPLETRLRAALNRAQLALDALPAAQEAQARIAELEAKLESAQQAPTVDVDALADRDAEIATLKAALAEQGDAPAETDGKIAELEDQLQQKDREIADLVAKQPDQDQVADLEAQIVDLRAQLAVSSAPTGDIEAVQKALDEERQVNADLGKRVAALKASIDRGAAEETRRSEARVAHIEALDEKTQRLQQVNADLRTINGQLRKALADGASEPELINRAMEAELDALREARETEAAEVAAVLNEMKPIIEGKS